MHLSNLLFLLQNRFLKTIFLSLMPIALFGQTDFEVPIDNRVDDLISKMTLQEKIGQMNQYNGFWNVTGPVPDGGDQKIKYSHLANGLVGSMLNVEE